MDLSWYNIYVAHKCFEGDDSLLYKNYYDYLLENRICAYTLPYDTAGYYTDERILQYLNNPRVVAFVPPINSFRRILPGWKSPTST